MKTIRFAVCGAGGRGTNLTKDVLLNLPDIEICGIYDPYTDRAESLADKVEEKTGKRPVVYSGTTELFDTEKPDAVLVSTSWESHIPVAVEALEKGYAVAMEVGAVYSEQECRDLVAAYEKTKAPFMLLENCCFGKNELFATAMVRDGRFGKIVYCHGAYRHDLRDEVTYGDVNRHYRLNEYMARNRDNYPTHELGPIAKILGINRGNRMVSLSARSTKAWGLHDYIEDKEDLQHLRDVEFKQGDMVETLITCENGELISLRLDTTLPTYYSREFMVRGTKGLYEELKNSVFLDGEDHAGNFTNSAEKYYDKYMATMWKEITPEIISWGHGGMDFFEFQAFCDCLRNGKEMPIDVYDAAAWMSIAYLTEQSIAQGGAVVEIPDFTNGAYKTREIKDVIDLEL